MFEQQNSDKVQPSCPAPSLQVFCATLGPQHTRTLVTARNEQHIKHKIIKLPADPQDFPVGPAGCGSSSSTGAIAVSAATNQPSVLAGSRGAVRPQGATGSSSAARQGKGRRGSVAAGAARGTSGSDSDIGSSDAEQLGQRSGRRGSKQQRGRGQAGSIGQAGFKAGRRQRQQQGSGSMQERLAAVMQARQVSEEAAVRQQQQQQGPIDTRDYTDPDHLGAGVFRATSQQQQLYRSVAADIRAHAVGGGAPSQQPGLLELQVLEAKPQVAAAAAALEADPSAVVRELHRGSLADATIAALRKPPSVEQARRLRQSQRSAAKQKGPDLLDRLY